MASAQTDSFNYTQTRLAWSASGYLALANPTGGVCVYDTATMPPQVFEFTHNQPVYAVVFHPTKAWLALGNEDGTVVIIELETQEIIMSLEAHAEAVTSLLFNSDGSYLATASTAENTAYLWNTETFEQAQTIEITEGGISDIQFNTDESQLAVADSILVAIWDIETENFTKVLFSENGMAILNSVRFVLDDSLLLAGDGNSGKLVVWDTTTRQAVDLSISSGEFISGIDLTQDGTWLATGGSTLKLWPLDNIEENTSPEPVSIADVRYSVNPSFNATGDMLAVTYADGIALIDTQTQEILTTLPHCEVAAESVE